MWWETALESLGQEPGYSVHQPSQHCLRHNQYSLNRRHPDALLLGIHQPPLLLAQQCQIIIAIVTKISMTSINVLILILSSLPFSYCKQLSEASETDSMGRISDLFYVRWVLRFKREGWGGVLLVGSLVWCGHPLLNPIQPPLNYPNLGLGAVRYFSTGCCNQGRWVPWSTNGANLVRKCHWRH